MKHTVKDWIFATRFWALPVSLMPVVVTFSYLFGRHMVPGVEGYVNFILALVGVALLHSAGNVLSDWFDYKSGVDNPEAFAVPNLVFGKFTPAEYLDFSICLFILGAAIGVLLMVRCGVALLWAGGAGILLTILYSWFKYHALGDLDIFVIFSILIILGSSYVISGAYCFEALVLALPIGIITVSVLHANNTVDIVSDGNAGIKTFAMLIGENASKRLYRVYMVIPYICVAMAVALGNIHPLSLLCFITFPQAMKNMKHARIDLSGLDRASSQLQLKFSLMLSCGLFFSFPWQ